MRFCATAAPRCVTLNPSMDSLAHRSRVFLSDCLCDARTHTQMTLCCADRALLACRNVCLVVFTVYNMHAWQNSVAVVLPRSAPTLALLPFFFFFFPTSLHHFYPHLLCLCASGCALTCTLPPPTLLTLTEAYKRTKSDFTLSRHHYNRSTSAILELFFAFRCHVLSSTVGTTTFSFFRVLCLYTHTHISHHVTCALPPSGLL